MRALADVAGREAGEARAVGEQVVEMVGGHELGVRLAVHVDELREEELDPAVAGELADLVGALRCDQRLAHGASLLRVGVVGEGHELAGVGVDPRDGHALVAVAVLAGIESEIAQKGRPLRPWRTSRTCVRCGRKSACARGGGDRRLLGDPDLVALAARRRPPGRSRTGPPPGRRAESRPGGRPAGVGGARRSDGTRCQYSWRG